MRIVVATLAAAAIAGLGFTADAAPSSKKKPSYSLSKEKRTAPRAQRGQEFGYDQSPDHYPVGSDAWWRAMDREGRGGCCGTPN